MLMACGLIIIIINQRMWSTVKDSMVKAIKDFMGNGVMPIGMNDTDITLIPKVDHPDRVTHFRPISLCNLSYKSITKLMSNLLKGLMQDVVSPQQSSFVPGRQITNNIIIYQRPLMLVMKNKKGSKGFMLFKIDLEKAYDRLDWIYSGHTL